MSFKVGEEVRIAFWSELSKEIQSKKRKDFYDYYGGRKAIITSVISKSKPSIIAPTSSFGEFKLIMLDDVDDELVLGDYAFKKIDFLEDELFEI